MMRFKLFLIIVGVGALVYGIHMTTVWASNLSPTTMKYADYLTSNVDADWLILEDCYIDYGASTRIDSVRKSRYGGSERVTGSDYYVTLWASLEDNRIKAFLKVEDKGMQSLMEEAWRVQDQGEAAYEAWVQANQSRLIQERATVQGLAQSGLSLSADTQRLLREAAMSPGTRLDPNFRIIVPNRKPPGLQGLGLVLVGLLILGGGGFWMYRSRRQAQYQPPPAPPNMPPPGYAPPQPGAPMPPAGGPRLPTPRSKPPANPG
jgi:hypothetical protein